MNRGVPYSVVLLAAPVGEPITLGEAYKHLRLPEDEHSDLIGALITAARTYFEEHDDRRLLSQTYKLTLDCFPCEYIEIPLRPLQMVNSVKYRDGDGVLQTLAGSEYQVDLMSFHQRIAPAYGKVWPVTRTQMNAVEIEFVVGYGDAVTTPDPAFTGSNYFATIKSNWVTPFSVTLQTSGGFHVNWANAAPADAEIEFLIQAGSPLQTLLRFTASVADGDFAEDDLSADIVFPSALASPSTIVGGVPQHLKQALLLLIGDFYENRENSTFAPNITELPFAYKALVGANRHLQI